MRTVCGLCLRTRYSFVQNPTQSKPIHPYTTLFVSKVSASAKKGSRMKVEEVSIEREKE